MTKFIKEQILIEVVLFDRGFNNWGIILKMQEQLLRHKLKF